MSVSSYLPAAVPIATLQDALGLTDAQLRRLQRIYGLSEVCRSAESETEMLLGAVAKLDGFAGVEERVRYVLRPKTVPAASPYPFDPMAEVRQRLGLRNALVFTVTDHACASGLLALDLAGALLEQDGDPDALALILAGEKAFTPAAQLIPDVAVMGEGTAAVLVAPGGQRDRLLGYATTTLGGPGGEVITNDEQNKVFRQIYPDALGDVTRAALEAAGCAASDLALVLPHNVNKVSWIRAADAMGVPRKRIFLGNVPRTGHCFCADPFLNYHTATRLGLLNPGERYLMVSVGLGSTFSATVFEH
ncbi:3-oxoacyl-[acyl-carrier-protein] synthase III C-terminal domain-containing protein [Amycolatopsis sp. WGS_07]|uniref:3-oxoacyl-[acyl-carrier-protein] synthase III C-terminal domain-containing protein n=1 Tax=Amycolatopsis sp. WGS_07 TaxID=3076764 RepID=UPI003873538F